MLNNSEANTETLVTLLSLALETSEGIKVNLNSKGEAMRLAQRCYSFRKSEQKKSVDGTSPYDSIVISKQEKPDGTWDLIIKSSMYELENLTIIDLATDEVIEL